MALSDIVRCWRTTDGQIFDDADDAIKHQNDIDSEKHLAEYKEKLQKTLDEVLKPLKDYIVEHYAKQENTVG